MYNKYVLQSSWLRIKPDILQCLLLPTEYFCTVVFLPLLKKRLKHFLHFLSVDTSLKVFDRPRKPTKVFKLRVALNAPQMGGASVVQQNAAGRDTLNISYNMSAYSVQTDCTHVCNSIKHYCTKRHDGKFIVGLSFMSLSVQLYVKLNSLLVSRLAYCQLTAAPQFLHGCHHTDYLRQRFKLVQSLSGFLHLLCCSRLSLTPSPPTPGQSFVSEGRQGSNVSWTAQMVRSRTFYSDKFGRSWIRWCLKGSRQQFNCTRMINVPFLTTGFTFLTAVCSYLMMHHLCITNQEVHQRKSPYLLPAGPQSDFQKYCGQESKIPQCNLNTV